MFWSWDSLSSSFRIVKSTFFSSKITQSWCYRHLLLVSVNTTPKRQRRASKIIALVLGL
jgi:hypothetical protein